MTRFYFHFLFQIGCSSINFPMQRLSLHFFKFFKKINDNPSRPSSSLHLIFIINTHIFAPEANTREGLETMSSCSWRKRFECFRFVAVVFLVFLFLFSIKECSGSRMREAMKIIQFGSMYSERLQKGPVSPVGPSPCSNYHNSSDGSQFTCPWYHAMGANAPIDLFMAKRLFSILVC